MTQPRAGGGQHRAQPGSGHRRAVPAAGKRRADVRPRYGRIAILVAAVTVTGVAVLGGFGLVPPGPQDATAASDSVAQTAKDGRDGGKAAEQSNDGRTLVGKVSSSARETTRTTTDGDDADDTGTTGETVPALPTESGSGKRIVFSEGAQRVWLVDSTGTVVRTYLVSGSLTDNLDPGTYAVYSRSRWAVGIDDSGTMQYFVRFTQGDSGAAIGFHTIPAKDGVPLQTQAQLGTPQSHGCIRQRTSDAIALWDFAPIGTTVVVTD